MVTWQKIARFLLVVGVVADAAAWGCGASNSTSDQGPSPQADAPNGSTDAIPTPERPAARGDGNASEVGLEKGDGGGTGVGESSDGARGYSDGAIEGPGVSDSSQPPDAASGPDGSNAFDVSNPPEATTPSDASGATDASTNAEAAGSGDESSPSDEGGAPPFQGVHFSDVDKSPSVTLSEDRLGMQQFTLGRQGVRSDVALLPGSGIFYFEATRLADGAYVELGVSTASVPLDSNLGDTDQTYGVDTGGTVTASGAGVGVFDATANSHYGFVVDYRQAHPFVMLVVLSGGAPQVVFRTELTQVQGALYIFAGGLRRKIGIQATINPGNDTTNFPFFYDPKALMRASGIPGADELVLGWGGTFAGAYDAPPSLIVSADQTMALGSSVTVSATAVDAEDGDLTARIVWADLATPPGARVSGSGAQFTLVPNALGVHQLQASVTDAGNKVVTALVRVTVTGTVPTMSPVQLQPDAQSGEGIELSSDGLSARFTAPAKLGIRANQGLLHGFRYFEIHRDIAPMNMGGGLVIQNGNLNPYDPLDVPPSCSVNVLGGTWQSLMFHANFPDGFATEEYYGFAVDYRGSFPTVYVIVKAQLVDTIPLPDVTVPIYPMLYGNPTVTPSGSAETINFGATPFHYDPGAVLAGTGVDLTGLVAGWGP